MQGEVIVLSGPEFSLKIPTNQIFPPPPIPTQTALVGQPVNFTGTITGLLGYSNQVSLACRNGTPRVPSFCPGTSVTPNGNQDVPFNFTVADATAGSYTFDIVATGVGAPSKTQRVQLNVPDMRVSKPTPEVVSVVTGFTTPSINLQVEAVGGFTGFVNMSCNNVPAGASCLIFPNAFQFGTGAPTSRSVAVLVDPVTAAPGIFTLQLTASTFFNNSQVIRSQPLTLRLLPADHFVITVPQNAVPNASVNVTVRAADPNGDAIVNYGGTVHLSSTDPLATFVPQDYTFLGPSDGGIKTFAATFKSVGPRTITVTDQSPFALQATSAIVKVDTVSPNNSILLQSSRGNTVAPHFQDESVTFTATVSSSSGTPAGVVRFYDGTRDLGAGTLVPAGTNTATASLTVSSLRPGGHSIFAVYEGGGGLSANLSLEISQPRSPAPRCQGDRCP